MIDIMANKPKKLSSDGAENKENTKSKRDGTFTKVIIRRLPPTMTESELMEQISPLPSHDYFLFVPPDYSLAPWVFSRAYINFLNVQDVILFRDRFDGYVFVDNRGNEYPAIVEMSPSPKLPKGKIKRDVKMGSLEDDPEYKRFLEQLKNPEPVQAMSLEACLEEIDKREKARKETKGGPLIPTPLTEFIKEKKLEKQRRHQEKRQKDEERRQQRIEWEKTRQRQLREQEKRRQEREAEREARKETDRQNVPPRFAAAKEKKLDKRREEGETGASAAAKEDKKSTKRYKERPSVPIYQPGRKKKDEKPKGENA